MPEKHRTEGESLGAVKQRPRGGVSAPEKRRPPPEVSTPATYKLFFPISQQARSFLFSPSTTNHEVSQNPQQFLFFMPHIQAPPTCTIQA